jgi:hypothetical protein
MQDDNRDSRFDHQLGRPDRTKTIEVSRCNAPEPRDEHRDYGTLQPERKNQEQNGRQRLMKDNH